MSVFFSLFLLSVMLFASLLNCFSGSLLKSGALAIMYCVMVMLIELF